MGQARQALGQASSNLEDVAEELQTSGPAAPFAATPLTSMPAMAGDGADKARARGTILGHCAWFCCHLSQLSLQAPDERSVAQRRSSQVLLAVGHPLLNTHHFIVFKMSQQDFCVSGGLKSVRVLVAPRECQGACGSLGCSRRQHRSWPCPAGRRWSTPSCA